MNTETPDFPQTLQDAIKHFGEGDNAFNFMVELRWPTGVHCPRCQTEKVGFIATRKIWQCKSCTTQKQFTVKTGTVFEDSPLSLEKWLAAIWLISNAKNGISSYEIHRSLGVTQKTGWFMLHRIRLALSSGSIEKLKGTVEADETFIGGKVKNMHPAKRRRHGARTGGAGKACVMGLLEREGRAVAKHVPNYRGPTLRAEIASKVEKGAEIFTDALPSCRKLASDYQHSLLTTWKATLTGAFTRMGWRTSGAC